MEKLYGQKNVSWNLQGKCSSRFQGCQRIQEAKHKLASLSGSWWLAWVERGPGLWEPQCLLGGSGKQSIYEARTCILSFLRAIYIHFMFNCNVPYIFCWQSQRFPSVGMVWIASRSGTNLMCLSVETQKWKDGLGEYDSTDGSGFSLCHRGVVSFRNGGERGDSGNDLQAGAAYKLWGPAWRKPR